MALGNQAPWSEEIRLLFLARIYVLVQEYVMHATLYVIPTCSWSICRYIWFVQTSILVCL
uniref:Uncharacterized protein n=2 Tax=Zea mays TaxID=4577 RepID=B6T0U1_MAIZE|nr:hypothetical protein [Zea mays]